MVDSIGKIGAPKINWYKLTVKEVQQYESEGVADDIPNEVKKWVEEMAKVANAPDNVTYEMTKGEVKTENTEEQATGASSIIQAIELGEQSDLAADEVESLMSEAETWTANAIDANTKAKEEYQSAMSKINSLVAERANAAASGNNAKVSTLNEQLAGTGKTALETIGGYANQVASIKSDLFGITATANETITLGDKTIKTAELANNDFDLIQSIISKGANAIVVGGNGLSMSLDSEIDISNFGQNIRAYMSDIKDSTSVTDKKQTANNETKQNKETDAKTKDVPPETVTKEKTATKTNKSTTQNKGTNNEDFTLADKDITADPIEILKRKERKGIV